MARIDKTKVKRALFITLSNVGDIMLTTPCVEAIILKFPEACVDVMVAPAGKDIFACHKKVNEIIIYDKKISLADKIHLLFKLKKKKYDLVVDLRNTLFPILLFPKYRTSLLRHKARGATHKKDVHLFRLEEAGIDTKNAHAHISVSDEDRAEAQKLLAPLDGAPFIVINPGAKSHVKRWGAEKFALLADRINKELSYKTVIVGRSEDKGVRDEVVSRMRTKPLDLLEKTNIRELACIIKKCALLVTNDSGPLHVASALGANILAFFGPTDERKYGPATSGRSRVLRKELECSPCEVAQCVNLENKYECLNSITILEAFEAAKELLGR